MTEHMAYHSSASHILTRSGEGGLTYSYEPKSSQSGFG
jgi:hypothetical protein